MLCNKHNTASVGTTLFYGKSTKKLLSRLSGASDTSTYNEKEYSGMNVGIKMGPFNRGRVIAEQPLLIYCNS